MQGELRLDKNEGEDEGGDLESAIYYLAHTHIGGIVISGTWTLIFNHAPLSGLALPAAADLAIPTNHGGVTVGSSFSSTDQMQLYLVCQWGVYTLSRGVMFSLTCNTV